MSVTSWVAENSSVVGVTSLVAAVLVASAAVVLSAPVRPEVPLNASATFSAVAGVVLVAIAAILAALGGGRGLWLTGLGGFLCLTAVIVVQFRALHLLYRRTREILDAVGERQLTGLHVDAVNRRLEQAVRNSERLVESVTPRTTTDRYSRVR